ncbi:hypothetical protein ACIPY1_15170 [Paenarthrobacter nicotinovorans]|uniref:hypothetical protein n=1 Tax=Paenarthrobacter nicotinovorans TaxID=29320 RepID=UPI0037F7E70F
MEFLPRSYRSFRKMSEFIRGFREVAGEKGARRNWSPAGYIDAWKSFVADCEEGYQWSIYEYENELEIRDVIDKVLTAPELTAYPELATFAEAIADTDERFAALLRSGPSVLPETASWWNRNLPGQAGPHLVADAEAHYAVHLRPVEP